MALVDLVIHRTAKERQSYSTHLRLMASLDERRAIVKWLRVIVPLYSAAQTRNTLESVARRIAKGEHHD